MIIPKGQIVKVYTDYDLNKDEWDTAIYCKSLGFNKFVHKDGLFQDLPKCEIVEDYNGKDYDLQTGFFRTIKTIEL